MATPHIDAESGSFAKAVLLPGDPLRARHVATTYLEDARQVTGVRNMLGFTGYHQGLEVSVMGTGMGIPSVSIYATELITEYNVKRLIRIGTCGAVAADLHIGDVVLAIGACTDSGVNRARYAGYDYAATADYHLLASAALAAEQAGIPVRVGNVHSGDLLYRRERTLLPVMGRMGVLAGEMEAAGLYAVAAELGARALTVLTVSNIIATGEETSAAERERSFDAMVQVALGALHGDGGAEHASGGML
jgi:purine-nucleoside phosphorylase